MLRQMFLLIVQDVHAEFLAAGKRRAVFGFPIKTKQDEWRGKRQRGERTDRDADRFTFMMRGTTDTPAGRLPNASRKW